MPVVGFTFSTMHAEKSEAPATSLKLNTTMTLTGLERIPLSLGASKEEALKMNFTYESIFDPSLGKIKLDGFLLYIDTKEAMTSIEKAWKKDKKVPKDLNNQLLNHIHSKCTVQAISLTKDIGLPPPIPLPRLNFEDKPSK